MRLGLALNPGFSERVTLYGNVVYNTPGLYTLRVPIPSKIGRLKKLGMTGMDGAAGAWLCAPASTATARPAAVVCARRHRTRRHTPRSMRAPRTCRRRYPQG